MISRCCSEAVEVKEKESGAHFECNQCKMPCETKISFLWEPKEKELEDAFV